MGGSWNASAPPLPKSNVSCHASPSLTLGFARLGSTTTGGGGVASTTSLVALAAATKAGVGPAAVFVPLAL